MKKYFIAVLGIILFQAAIAQSKNSDLLSVSVGATVPVGSYAQADAGTFNHYNNTSGYAHTGVTFGIDYAHYFFSRWALKGTVYFSEHGSIDTKGVANLASSYQDAFDVDQAAVNTSGVYKAINVMVGPQYSIPINKFIIDTYAMAGVVSSLSTPQIAVTLTDAGIDYNFTQKSSTASAFGWQVGAGVRYPFNDKLSLILKADYFNSSGLKVNNENRNNSAGRLVTNQPLSWVNVSAGIAFSLGKK